MFQDVPHLSQVIQFLREKLADNLNKMTPENLAAINAESHVHEYMKNAFLPLNTLTTLKNRRPEFDGQANLLKIYLGEPGSNSLKFLRDLPIYPENFSFTTGFNIKNIKVDLSEGWIGHPARTDEHSLKDIRENLERYLEAFNACVSQTDDTLKQSLTTLVTSYVDRANAEVSRKTKMANDLGIDIKT